jgi:hypothetical protein
MTTTDLDRIGQPRTIQPASSEATAVEQARAVAEVAAAVRVAQDNPRDMTRALAQMRQACSQQSLADRAFYSLPRAGGRVEGSTVHLARELARCYGNMDSGVREMRRDDEAGISELQAWAWDQENNVRISRSFIVPHARMVGSAKRGDKRRERLDDLADIANNNNSVAARALRECIFNVLPVWFREEAESIAMATLNGSGAGKTIDQQIADAVTHFADTFGVTVEQLEARLDRPRKQWTVHDVSVLRVIASEISRGEKTIEQQFPAPDLRVTAEEITGGAA